ncbi:longitudinals lacking isoforms a b d l [Lasius niger]|uniref:Longitudinals lacking isoforms a b d l n=1 Tax=Lasius niger TaxID=67767 RepID=A0A0J7L365_LASNI|nr:longitudinals lacking isoforms a b d l [Lasius niger]
MFVPTVDISNTEQQNGPKKDFPCPQCGSKVSSKFSLKRHLEETCGINRNPDAEFQCKRCNRGYGSKSSLKRHLETECGGKRNYFCNLCHSRFSQRSSVTRHIKNSCKNLKISDNPNASTSSYQLQSPQLKISDNPDASVSSYQLKIAVDRDASASKHHLNMSSVQLNGKTRIQTIHSKMPLQRRRQKNVKKTNPTTMSCNKYSQHFDDKIN